MLRNQGSHSQVDSGKEEHRGISKQMEGLRRVRVLIPASKEAGLQNADVEKRYQMWSALKVSWKDSELGTMTSHYLDPETLETYELVKSVPNGTWPLLSQIHLLLC